MLGEKKSAGKGRFAPSPTGDFHIGNLRTALLAWAFARHDGRTFHMRIEDLDERSRPEYVTRQLEDLTKIGVTWDGPELFQSKRLERYEEVFSGLASQDWLYECFCTRKELANVVSAPHQPPGSYPGTCRNLTADEREQRRARFNGTNRGAAYRLKTRENSGSVHDRQCGAYQGAIDDLVVRRGDGIFSYNFVSVVDDGDYGVDQIVRGDDLLPSTPRQVYLQHVLGYQTPEYAHVPLVLNTAGARLAKRDGAVTLRQLGECGWDVSDIVELLAGSLGIRHDLTDREGDPLVDRVADQVVDRVADSLVDQPGIIPRSGIRSADEFLKHFDPDLLPRTPWHFDVEKLEKGPAAYYNER